MDINNVLLSILIASICTTIPILYLFIRSYIRKNEHSLEMQKVELEMFRQSLENSIYSSNDKLVSNRARWKDVNHMLFEAAQRNIVRKPDQNSYLESLSIDRDDIKISSKKAFLLAPINPRFSSQIGQIKSACASIGVECETADEEYISGPILSVIVKKMLSASLVIAIIDGRNPNVFYELGLAHAFGKTVVMVAGGLEDIPFDIQSQRLVLVDWKSKTSIDKIRKAISESIFWTSNN
ncbi:hypothetical protein [Pseudomonas sp. S2_B07]